MWFYPKYKTEQTFNNIAKGLYGTFKGNIRRNWGVWPMWISSANDKGFVATASTIVFNDKSTVDGRGLWTSGTSYSLQSWSCDFDDLGYSYFSGNYGTIKRDIMTSTQIWGNTTSYITNATDYVVRYNDNAVYIGSDDFYKPLRKVDTNGNELWSALYNTSNALTSSTIYSIVFDDSNNVYVCGKYSANDGVVAKYDSSGNQLWTRYTTNELYDISIYSNALYIACQNNANRGVHIRLTDGSDSGFFGTNGALTRSSTEYNNVVVTDQYIIVSSPNGTFAGIDLYNRSDLAFTASYTASNIFEISDLELYNNTLYFSDRGGGGFSQKISRMNATFSRIEESWSPANLTNAIKLKTTY
jgi:hypothetical protein